MSEGRAKNAWQHTSVILSMLANANRDTKKSRAFTPDDFNPFTARKDKHRIVIDKSNVHLLKQYFVPTKGSPHESKK